MTLERAIRLAKKWSKGYVCTLRDGEAVEYHELALALFERELKNREENEHDRRIED